LAEEISGILQTNREIDMIDFGLLREEIKVPLELSEIRELKKSTLEKNTYCSLQPEISGYVCLCSCILDGKKYYIHEKG
jgi:hypothetical protein